jgi:hypothetical protein
VGLLIISGFFFVELYCTKCVSVINARDVGVYVHTAVDGNFWCVVGA